MRVLGRNMAYFLKCKEAGIKAGLELPEIEDNIYTNPSEIKGLKLGVQTSQQEAVSKYLALYSFTTFSK